MTDFEGSGFAPDNAAQREGTQQASINSAVEIALATYRSLGVVRDEGKARDGLERAVTPLVVSLPESVTAQPYDIVVAPRLGLGDSEMNPGGLIGLYDELTGRKGNLPTAVAPQWNSYTPEELNQGQVEPFVAYAVLPGDGRCPDEPGMYFAGQTLEDGQTLEQQRENFKEVQKEHGSDRIKVDSLTVAGYVIRDAMQLERGETLMDGTGTRTRFISLDDSRVIIDGERFVPAATSWAGEGPKNGQVTFDIFLDSPVWFDGVRLCASLAVQPSLSPTRPSGIERFLARFFS